MLGHLKPPLCRLPAEAGIQYRRVYCSLCYSLRRQFGLPASLLVSHELAISLLAGANTLDVPLEYRACPARLLCRSRLVLRHETIDRTARLNLLLVWLKLADWRADSRRVYGGLAMAVADRWARPILSELSRTTREFIGEYLRLIENPRPDFAETRTRSGLLARHVFTEMFGPSPVPLGQAVSLLGEIIPVADALLDLERDVAKGQYNPIAEAAARRALSLEQAWSELYRDYSGLAGRVRTLLPETGNRVFSAVVAGSLAQLSARIGRDEEATAGPSSRRRKKRADGTVQQSGWCDCCECSCECCGGVAEDAGCCDSCGCCECHCCDCG